MILQIIFMLLLIVILLIFIFFLKPLGVYLSFHRNNQALNGEIIITHYFLKLRYVFEKKALDVFVIWKSRNILLRTINLDSIDENNSNDNNDGDEDKGEDNTDEYEDEFSSNLLENAKEIYPTLKASTSDLYKIVVLIVTLCKFKESNIKLDFGLKNNNLTIKICNILWAITAPLYPFDIHILITPVINKAVVNFDCEVSFDIIIMNILRIIFKIITSINILKLIIKIIKIARR